MPWRIEGKIAVVSGASSAMGHAIARRLAGHRATLALLSRDPSRLPADLLSSGAEGPGGAPCSAPSPAVQWRGFAYDCLGGAAASDAVMKQVRQELGPVSVLVNCAGATLNQVHARSAPADYDTIMDTNVRGALDLTRAALRHGGMLQAGPAGGAAVVHIGSVVGEAGNAGQVLYGASKAALSGAARCWAKEYGGKNIRFNVVAPGLVEGRGMSGTLSDQQRQRWVEQCPLKRLATPEEVADAVELALLSSYLSGQTIVLDGGGSL